MLWRHCYSGHLTLDGTIPFQISRNHGLLQHSRTVCIVSSLVLVWDSSERLSTISWKAGLCVMSQWTGLHIRHAAFPKPFLDNSSSDSRIHVHWKRLLLNEPGALKSRSSMTFIKYLRQHVSTSTQLCVFVFINKNTQFVHPGWHTFLLIICQQRFKCVYITGNSDACLAHVFI
jgi:hypothetical protein